MDQKTTLVRIGGDIARRRVAHEAVEMDVSGRQRLISQEPELRDGEMIVRLLSDSIPLIIKAR